MKSQAKYYRERESVYYKCPQYIVQQPQVNTRRTIDQEVPLVFHRIATLQGISSGTLARLFFCPAPPEADGNLF